MQVYRNILKTSTGKELREQIKRMKANSGSSAPQTRGQYGTTRRPLGELTNTYGDRSTSANQITRPRTTDGIQYQLTKFREIIKSIVDIRSIQVVDNIMMLRYELLIFKHINESEV